jgi:chaperonin GroES
MNFKPLHHRLLVKPDAPVEQTKGGVLLPDDLIKPVNRGTVVAVGTGRIDNKGNRHSLDFEVGERVLVAKWGEHEFVFEDTKHYLIDESDIVGREK